MADSSTPSSESLRSLVQQRARAEFAEWSGMVEECTRRIGEIDESGSPLRRRLETGYIALEVGHEMGLSEGQVYARIGVVERVRDLTPTVWDAWRRGVVDAPRAREISSTLERLERPDSIERLDSRAVAYAETHTLAELRGWLRRFVMRVEGDLAAERANAEREKRYVDITHFDDGMGMLTAYQPSHILAAMDSQMNAAAKALGADDPRTKAQRRADIFAERLLSDSGPASFTADIAVTVGADVLAGASDAYAVSADGSWGIPKEWAREVALRNNPFWSRMVVEPVTGDVLSFESVGRFASGVLAKAIVFRDGVCRAPGCLKPAVQCDLDHRRPSPEGPTSGDNLWALCRKHHAMKGHGILVWLLRHAEVVA